MSLEAVLRGEEAWHIEQGDCREVLRRLPEASLDAAVTDPPYGLEFMGKDWDRLGAEVVEDPADVGGFQDGNGGNPFSRSRVRFGATARSAQSWHEAWAREAFRVLKPGGHLLAFGGTRTFHRLACAVEDAGFEVRDTIAWLYGTGFPKSHNLIGAWEGWGTALKPAFEPIVVARKPLEGTVAANVERHGTGALNVEACRIDFREPGDFEASKAKNAHARFGSGPRENRVYGADARPRGEGGDWAPSGRWPANVVLGHAEECGEACAASCALVVLDQQSGTTRSPSRTGRGAGGYAGGLRAMGTVPAPGDAGGASRFFYCAKASRAEREAGLEAVAPRLFAQSQGAQGAQGALARGEAEYLQEGIGLNRVREFRNHHPTVKPLALMRWLVRMVTPPAGVVVDPFVGSGTTVAAALLEGFRCIGIEQDAEYLGVARARVEHWAREGSQKREAGQTSLEAWTA